MFYFLLRCSRDLKSPKLSGVMQRVALAQRHLCTAVLNWSIAAFVLSVLPNIASVQYTSLVTEHPTCGDDICCSLCSA